jgi:hypothetical protein
MKQREITFLALFNDPLSVKENELNGKIIVNGEYIKIWKVTIVKYFKVLF